MRNITLVPPRFMLVVTDGTEKRIDIGKLSQGQLIKALQYGIAELVHTGEVRIDNIRPEE